MISIQGNGVLHSLGLGDARFVGTKTSSVTTAWGVQWDETQIARDIMQNFFDANRARLEEVTVAVNGRTATVSGPATFELERLFYLGSEKGEGDIGQYGEGFKAAAMCLLRDHRVEPVVISGNSVVGLRISEQAVKDTQLQPILYDFFETAESVQGTRLILQGCSTKLARAIQAGMTHFLYAGNSLISSQLWRSWDGHFAVYRSTADGGYIFYKKLNRGEITDIPLILVVDKEYKVIENKIKNDRDRNAFGEPLLRTFYQVFAKYGVGGNPAVQRVMVEAARPCWTRGHALLSEIAGSAGWRGSQWKKEWVAEVFGGQFFAISSAHDAATQLGYERMERAWKDEGRQALPGYFARFGVPSAQQVIQDAEQRALDESRRKHKRLPTPGELRCIRLLNEVTRELAPEITHVLDHKSIAYTVAETETLLGELKEKRGWKTREVFWGAEVFLADFPEALAVFLHEHAHVFGYDGSHAFTDCLTDLLATLVRHRSRLDRYEQAWDMARAEVLHEREHVLEKPNEALEQKLSRLGEAELRQLVSRLPPLVLSRMLVRRPEVHEDDE